MGLPSSGCCPDGRPGNSAVTIGSNIGVRLRSGARRVVPAPLVDRARPLVVRHRYRRLDVNDGLFVSYPKSGTTWLRFLLAEALTEEEAQFDTIHEILPPFVSAQRGHCLLPGRGRLVASHEPLLPCYGPYTRPVIYLVRDGRDVAVSYFHHIRQFRRMSPKGALRSTFSEFLPEFLGGRVDGYGPWHQHVDLALDARAGLGNILLVRYEEVVEDTELLLSTIVSFLGLSPNAARIRHAIESNTRDRMKRKEAESRFLARQAQGAASFVRQGRVGDWKSVFNDEDSMLFHSVAGSTLLRAGYLDL